MNSVVHHLPSPEQVFSNVNRMLRPGGLVVLAHEPNLLHFRHPVVGNLDRLVRFLRVLKSMRPRSPAATSPFIDRVNARLIERGVVKEPLTVEKIESIVDIHSPTAGRTVDAARGFDPKELAASSFPSYALVYLETYRHFGKLDVVKRPWLARVQRAMERCWPEAGALFLMMMQKPKA
jgi:SAM-dependent methyltransferase